MKISVIIPVYNASRFISECLDSVLLQSDVCEIICVDDCSTDNSAQLVVDYATKHPELIKLIKLEKNSGASHARNVGLKSATGDYIQLLDADDLLLPQKIKHQVELCNSQNKFPEFIIGDYLRINAAGNEKIIVADCKDVWFGLMNTRLGCTCSNLWKKEALEAVGGFDTRLKSSQEYNLMFRLLKNGAATIYDDQPFTIVREQDTGSISSGNKGANWKRYVQLRCDVIDYMKSTGKLTADNQQDFHQLLFDAIRSWYPFSKDEAFLVFKKYIPQNFIPAVSTVTSKNYLRIYRLFGFKLAEKIKTLKKR